MPLNRGVEGAIFLRYIVDNYENFPDIAIFLHPKPYEHQTDWLEMIGCVNPNASYININFGRELTRSPEFWGSIELWIEQCWRDVLQITLDLQNNTAEFLRLVPPSKLLR